MKKTALLLLILVVLFSALFVSCRRNYKEYSIGDTGPAGGLIFYDCDADNDSGNADGLLSKECGWRYLEAAPADLRVIEGKPSVDKTDSRYESGDKYFIFGYYRKSADGDNLFVNCKTSYSEKDCTGTAVGTGKKNTELLVKAMGSAAYSYRGLETTSVYAAKLCSDLVYNGFDDWFLPSKDELNLICTNLYAKGLGGFSTADYKYDLGIYWSSSECCFYYDNSIECRLAFSQSFTSIVQIQSEGSRIDFHRVRPVRAF